MEPTAWLSQGEKLSQEHKAHQCIADWLVAGLDIKPATEVYDAAEQFFPQYARRTFIEWVSVARAFPESIRIDSLTFSHHQAVMRDEATGTMPDAFRQDWLRKAADSKWPVAALREHIAHDLETREAAKNSAETESELETPAASTAPQQRTAPRLAFTLASLKPARRAQLEKLATARRLPVHVLAQTLIEEGLDSYIEEINAHDERVEAIAHEKHAPAIEARDRNNEEYRQRRIDELIAKFGGDEADYRAAIREFSGWVSGTARPKLAGEAECYNIISECGHNKYVYAYWRVHEMLNEAYRKNEYFDYKRAEAARPAQEETAVAA